MPPANPVVIAVIDSGFDLQHPALNFVDPARHLDVPSYLRVKRDQTPSLAGLLQARYAGPSHIPHGTAVAGIAAAKPFPAQVDGRTYQGVAPGFPILPIRVSPRPSAAEIAIGIDWAVRQGARVVTLSLQTTQAPMLDAAIRRAVQRNVVVVAAVGNYTKRHPRRRIDYPAAHPDVLAVGAADNAGRRKRIEQRLGNDWGSQYGPGLDVLAPGVDVPTIDERGERGYVPGDINLQSVGTSVAAPQVAGLVARLLALRPGLTVAEVTRHIIATCDRPPSFHAAELREGGLPWSEEEGYGVVNIRRALVIAHR